MNSQGSTGEKNTHAQRVKMRRILLTNGQGGEMCLSDVITHTGHWLPTLISVFVLIENGIKLEPGQLAKPVSFTSVFKLGLHHIWVTSVHL